MDSSKSKKYPSDTQHSDKGMKYVSDIFSWTLTLEAYFSNSSSQKKHAKTIKLYEMHYDT